MSWALAGLLILISGLLLYWLLVTTEGAYLGQRVVIWLYDLTAHKYDAIKQFDLGDDSRAITAPLMKALTGSSDPLILDVASGTGRVPVTLLADPAFQGRVVALEPSAKMAALAARKLGDLGGFTKGSWHLVRQTAAPLPFPSETFHAVICLEALEFLPSDAIALKEMWRVLRPGGLLMTTRRSGRDAPLFIGRYRSAAHFERMLSDLGLVQIRTLLWQVDYDMVLAHKPAGAKV